MTTNSVYGNPTLRPANSTAGRILGKGISYESPTKIEGGRHLAERPLLVSKVPRPLQSLVGITIGSIKVLGIIKKPGKKLWAIRCICGNYESRSTGQLQNPNPGNTCCNECSHLGVIRNRNGKAPIIDPKSYLQEKCHRYSGSRPIYHAVERPAENPEGLFRVVVMIGNTIIAKGEGQTSKLAEIDAARLAIEAKHW